jgi:regulator of protease activity HflC (stomatin/prohibitin superfamily)
MEGFILFCLSVTVFFLVIILMQAVRVIKQYEKGVVLRLGKYAGTMDPGINFLVPFVDSLIVVDMRERVINVPPQYVITKDNVTVNVDAVIYYKVIDPVKAEYEVENFNIACVTLAQTNLRNVVGDITLDDSLTSRDRINTNLRLVLDEATHNWGVKITRVEVQKIDPPHDITDAMSKQMKAEREKRAVILEAEGVKQSKVLEAEGFQQSEILKAEGDAQARIRRAQGEAESIKLVSEAAEKYFTGRAEVKMKLEVAEKALRDNTKYIVSSGMELVNVITDNAAIVPTRKS